MDMTRVINNADPTFPGTRMVIMLHVLCDKYERSYIK